MLSGLTIIVYEYNAYLPMLMSFFRTLCHNRDIVWFITTWQINLFCGSCLYVMVCLVVMF